MQEMRLLRRKKMAQEEKEDMGHTTKLGTPREQMKATAETN